MSTFIWDGVWAILTVAVVVWELLAFLVRHGSLQHLTISQIIKRFEGTDVITGRPVVTPAGIVRRVLIAAGLVVLFLHLVLQLF